MLYDPKWEQKAKTQAEPWRATLLRAADLIREHGLAKYTQQDSEGRMCLHGAISIAATGKPFCELDAPIYCEASAAVRRHLLALGVSRDLIGNDGCAQWNNKPERTADQVIAALEGAACA
jgi:hypothetical protein